MFKWIVNEEESDISKVLELSNLKDFYQKVPLYQKVNDFPYNNLCEKLDYDIVVLKPVKDDFLILYVNKVFWRIYGENFPDYMKGRLLGELFPIFKKTGVIKKYTDSYNNKTENKFLFKMLEDENLIFAGINSVFVKTIYSLYLQKIKQNTMKNMILRKNPHFP